LEGVLKRALKQDDEQELAKSREKEEEHAKEKKNEHRFGSTRAVAASSTLAKDKAKTSNHPAAGQPSRQVVVLCFSQAQIELICSVLFNAANLKRFFGVPSILLLPLFVGKGKYREVIHIYVYICVCVWCICIYIYI